MLKTIRYPAFLLYLRKNIVCLCHAEKILVRVGLLDPWRDKEENIYRRHFFQKISFTMNIVIVVSFKLWKTFFLSGCEKFLLGVKRLNRRCSMYLRKDITYGWAGSRSIWSPEKPMVTLIKILLLAVTSITVVLNLGSRLS